MVMDPRIIGGPATFQQDQANMELGRPRLRL